MTRKGEGSDMPKGFNCATCKTFHVFGGYVAAHWSIRLTHTCDCGAKHEILKGKATLIEKGKK